MEESSLRWEDLGHRHQVKVPTMAMHGKPHFPVCSHLCTPLQKTSMLVNPDMGISYAALYIHLALAGNEKEDE